MFFPNVYNFTCFAFSETPEALVVGLDAYQLYEFQVRAHTKSAEGPYTDKVQCSTKEGSK